MRTSTDGWPEFFLCFLGEAAEKLGVFVGEGSGAGVHDTEGPDSLPVGRLDGVAGVEADTGVPCDEAVVGVSGVGEGVFDDELSVSADGDITEL
ncbi:hypothetical protein AX769_22585 (plasmid) [Frondihabitans sp. PAMC 28766]|nr:hypothetical protein AX769_22585 [Frondihabitans sp. PAMC 28766]